MTESSTGFVAADAVPELSYDFSAIKAYAEAYPNKGKSEIPEPSTEQVAEFWATYIGLLNRSKGTGKAPDVPDDETPEDRDERIKAQIVEGRHRSIETVAERRAIVSKLCSNQPTTDELDKLPHRIFDAFESYMMGAISPEG